MRQCTPKGMAPKADTILDRIAEFAKIICMPQILCPSNASTLALRLSVGRILCQTDNRSAMSKLERTEIIKRGMQVFSANS